MTSKLLALIVAPLLLPAPAIVHPAFAADTIHITEFMADNGGDLLDENGDASDWIEIHNSGSGPMNLGGWHLTDDRGDLARWTFPATNLPAGGYLIVFASGKDRAVAGLPLHANFQLDATGEYLALVRPDNAIAHEYAPGFPSQVRDISYGIDLNGSVDPFVVSGAAAQWKVPQSPADMPADWSATNFNAAGWHAGPTGIGFDSNVTNLPQGEVVNLAAGKAVVQSSTRDAFGSGLAVNGNYTDFTHTLAGVNLPATWEVNLGNTYGLERIVLWNRTSFQSRLRDITVRIVACDNSSIAYTSALLNPENVLGGGQVNLGPSSISLNLTQLTGGLVMGGRVRVTRTPDQDLSGSGGFGSSSEADVLSLAEVEVFGKQVIAPVSAFSSSIRSDVGVAMSNVNASVLIRMPFIIPEEELPALDQLTLRMKYDDGFVASLNGVEIARVNASDALHWNSHASASRNDADAVQFFEFDVSAFIGNLVEGQNVLAIHGLNSHSTDDDFLIDAELVGRRVDVLPERYYTTPTPSGANSGGALGRVADTKFSVDRGFHETPFSVAITTATPGAEVRFTTNGSAPSAVNGIVYSAPIPIHRTTTLRAIATRPGWLPSDVDTHTYIFLSNVMTQSTASVVAQGFPASWPGSSADYAMDPSVIATYGPEMKGALQSLPSLFITTTVSNLFDPSTGIYVNPLQSGAAWERAVSVELVGTNGATEFQENCGLRIQGGVFFRSFSMTQKKSFRVLFKSVYGPGKLRHDLFKEPGAAKEFDGFVLRAGANDGYAWSGAGSTVQFTRDEFGRRIHLDMGHPSPRGLFVHLYLNGLYWGMYNLVERPNEDFSETYLGGESEEWDASAAGDFKNGGSAAAARWNSFVAQAGAVTTHSGYQALQGNHPDGSRNPALPRYFDPRNYIDYMIANMWGGNWDWPNKNFWFGYNPNSDLGYRFYMWDYENTMGNSRDRSPLTMVSPRPEVASQWVGLPHDHLNDYSEYRIDFADRVQRWFFNGGLLTPQSLTNRYQQLANSIEPAIIAESARWGDDNRIPAYGLPQWLAERNWILTNYLPNRSAIVLNQFRTRGLFPSIGAPVFNQWDGAIPAGFHLTMSHTNSGGTIFFTLDGTDPRVAGSSAVRVMAQAYGEPVMLNSPTQVRARVLRGGGWSPIVEAVFYPPQDVGKLVLSEIMYNAPGASGMNGSEFDFIELKNSGTAPLDLSGLTFTAGISFTFTNGTVLPPGAFGVIVRNPNAFSARYPGVPIVGAFAGNLDNGGETLTLAHPLGETVFSISYDDELPWPVTPDGFGYSLVQRNPAASQAPDQGAKWRASANPGGSPGADDPVPAIPEIVINEVLANTIGSQLDAIELHNPTDDDVDISGWFLSDDSAVPTKYRIPDGTHVPPNGFVVFTSAEFDPTPASGNNFGLGADGDEVYLFSADVAGNLTGYNHGWAFEASLGGESFGRHITSAAEEFFPRQRTLTLGAENSLPQVGPVVISEIHYNPAGGGLEFVELANINPMAVSLFHPLHPTNTWAVNGIGFTFPTGVTLEAGETVLIAGADAEQFRSQHGLSTELKIFGPFSGTLQNSGENIEVRQPVTPAATSVPFVVVDAVQFDDKAPWPPAADGTGFSLQRVDLRGFGSEPANWMAALPSPGEAVITLDSDGDGLPDAWELANGTLANVQDAADDPDQDGHSNWLEFLAGTNPQDADDVLRVVPERMESGLRLSFWAAANRTYSLQFTAAGSFASWTEITNFPAESIGRIVTVTNLPLAGAERFYRILTPAKSSAAN